jgi:hypothetical protein
MIETLQLKRTAVVLALAVTGSAPAQEPGPAAPVAEIPKKIAVGTNGLFQPGILLQGWYVLDVTDAPANTFRVRRAEIAAKGEIVPGFISYSVMFDPSRVREPTNTTLTDSGGDTVVVKAFPGAASAFQDLFFTFLTPYADVSVGQFKIPVSWEGYNSSAKIILPERSLAGQAYGDKRDLGVRVTKTFKTWMYSAGIFNGAVSNNLDTNNSKDLGLRLEVYPLEGLTLAGVGYASIGERLAATTRDRWEFDARYERGPFLFQSEYLHAYDGGGAGRVEAHGFYGVLAYMVTDKLQPVVRVGYLDPNLARDLDPVLDRGADEGWEFNAGVNYYLQKHEAKLQLAYQRVQYETKTPLNEVILAAQVWF